MANKKNEPSSNQAQPENGSRLNSDNNELDRNKRAQLERARAELAEAEESKRANLQQSKAERSSTEETKSAQLERARAELAEAEESKRANLQQSKAERSSTEETKSAQLERARAELAEAEESKRANLQQSIAERSSTEETKSAQIERAIAERSSAEEAESAQTERAIAERSSAEEAKLTQMERARIDAEEDDRKRVFEYLNSEESKYNRFGLSALDLAQSSLSKIERDRLEIAAAERDKAARELADTYNLIGKVRDESKHNHDHQINLAEYFNDLRLKKEALARAKRLLDLEEKEASTRYEDNSHPDPFYSQFKTTKKKIDYIRTEEDKISALRQNKIELEEDLQASLHKLREVDEEYRRLIIKNEDLKNQEQIIENAQLFLKDAIKVRSDRFKRYQLIADSWAFFAFVLMILGLGFFHDSFIAMAYGDSSILEQNISWSTAWFVLLKGGFFISAFGIAIKMCMQLRDRYMDEAIKDDERLHSMSYGEFYVKAYGASSDRAEIVEALKGWHSRDRQEERDFDINERVAESIMNTIAKTSPSKGA